MMVTLDATDATWHHLPEVAKEAIRWWLVTHDLDPRDVRAVSLWREGAVEVEEYVYDDAGRPQLKPGYGDAVWTRTRTVPVTYLPQEWPL